MAPVAYTLWQEMFVYDPARPDWTNRDRFVLSVGHASMLLYSLLHLAEVRDPDGGLAVRLDDIKSFRQVDSRTPGHPEYRMTTGVETTTGPLAQGCGNSVGMAMAERALANRYNKPGFDLFDHHIWVLAGDGCMMEGLSSEAASTAAHLRLGNLTWIYDSNRITIEGSTDLAFDEDVMARFAAYGWHVEDVASSEDTAAMLRALQAAKAETGRPSFIRVHSTIGQGAPTKAGTHKAHGEALGVDEVKGAKKSYGWPEDSSFLVPDGVHERFAEKLGARGAAAAAEWDKLFAAYRAEYPDLAAELDNIAGHTLPDGWDSEIPVFPADAKGLATRDSSQKVLNAIGPHVPWLIGGAADLSPSTKSNMTFQGAGSFQADSYGGRNLHFGIREHAMGAIVNGMATYGLRSYGSGFLIFSDYMKAPIRLSAIMELPVIYIFTHDSIGVGEDGPTHQPIEQLATLRATPGLHTIRPADANEVAAAWRVAMTASHQPTALVLSRQALPTLDRSEYASADGLARGAYVLHDAPGGPPQIILMATGSEVALIVAAAKSLAEQGVRARLVSMPSWDIFEKQDEAYRRSVFPPEIKARVAVEQAATIGWDRYVGLDGRIIAMHTFGASAPLGDLLKKFGFTADKVLEAARSLVAA